MPGKKGYGKYKTPNPHYASARMYSKAAGTPQHNSKENTKEHSLPSWPSKQAGGSRHKYSY